ncbi:MAG: hypothetical protein JO015_06630 [Verrucomicrobia bacterium]|nr:hypothetical protein [Verrucomicrobiota bacterium]
MAQTDRRPRLQFDLSLVEALRRIYATAWEMAAFFGWHESTIYWQLQKPESEFCKTYAKGSSHQNLRLRAKLVEVARRGACFILWKLATHHLGYSAYPSQDINVQSTAISGNKPAIIIDEMTKKRLNKLTEVIRCEEACPHDPVEAALTRRFRCRPALTQPSATKCAIIHRLARALKVREDELFRTAYREIS